MNFLKKTIWFIHWIKKFSQSKSLVNYKKIKADMTKFNQIKKILKKISLSKGCIDVLINCAGITQSLKNNLLDYWETTIKNNLTSAFMASMYALPYLKKSKYPSIINITSITAKLGMSNNPAYNVSKAGLQNLSYSLAMDFRKHKIQLIIFALVILKLK